MLPGPTERLRFRSYREDDAAFVLDMFADEQAQEFFSNVGDLEAAARWVAYFRRHEEERGYSLWMLEALDDGRPLGDCGLIFQEAEGRPLIEVGYHLHARERGQGFALEAARRCLAFAFEQLDPPEVVSFVHPDNEPSAKVARKLHASERGLRWHDHDYRLFYTPSGS